MAGALPLVGAGGNEGDGRQELAAPACSGALALRRITSLLAGARRADAQGDHVQARELYSEILKVQRTLSRAPLGSIGKSLREVTVGVEARLQVLRQELQGDSTTCSSSRPTTNCSAPSSSSTACAAPLSGRGSSAGMEELMAGQPGSGALSSRVMVPPSAPAQELPQQAAQACGVAASPPGWDTSAIPECPNSARDGCGGRPTTRDGGAMRPYTQDSSRRPSRGPRQGSLDEGGRPATRDDTRLQQQQQSLDGVRPSTRDGARLQQMIDGARRSNSSRHGSGERPQTRDGVRPPTRSGPGERRGQDVSIRQVTGRRKRHQQQAPDVLSLEPASGMGVGGPAAALLDASVTTAVASPSPDGRPPQSLSPCADADESVELLE